jgi:alpha-galactosidase
MKALRWVEERRILAMGFSLLATALAAGQPLKLVTPRAEFQVLPSGNIRATRLQDGQRFSLDGAEGGAGDSKAYILDLGKAHRSKVGRHWEIPYLGNSPVSKTLILEVRESRPEVLFASLRVTNLTATRRSTGKVDVLRAQFAKDHLWSFQGASKGWGLDDVMLLCPGSHENLLGTMVEGGLGGGIPVIDFWNASTGEALGCLSADPCALPVGVAPNGRAAASVAFPARTLAPSETWTSPWCFLVVHQGDFFEPVSLWSRLMTPSAWRPVAANVEAYEASWCSWGFGFDITPAQMLGVLPKLKELDLRWATLDDRWFDAYGDWRARPDTFPGDALKTLVDAYHRAGIQVQLWWLPIAAEIANGKGESHTYRQSQVVRDHPDWLVLDAEGRPAIMVRDLAVLDPSLPEVQAYFRDMAVAFIRDYGFDGFKMDNVYAVPPCFNPRHHHASPLESTRAVGEVYRQIQAAVQALKPGAVIQICPCGTTPAAAWLPWMNQAVTADPVGAVQVRRRIKLYKALLGPTAAVYGDHVELSAMQSLGHDEWLETGEDFASTVGTGGVPGTKFVWPPTGQVPKSGPVDLNPAKNAIWHRWLDLYREQRLSSGTFLNLYTLGVDLPEGYAISRDGRMHYGFFATGDWKGEVELRGLEPGSHRVRDFVEGRDLGEVVAVPGKPPRLSVAFKDHLLLEVVP